MTDVKIVTFEDAEIPTDTGAGRPSIPNPYLDVVATLKIRGTEGAGSKTFTIDGDIKSDEVKRAKEQLHLAGRKAGKTVRVKISDAGKGKTFIMFWAIPQIVQAPRKPKVADESASPAGDGAPEAPDADGPITEASPDQGEPPVPSPIVHEDAA